MPANQFGSVTSPDSGSHWYVCLMLYGNSIFFWQTVVFPRTHRISYCVFGFIVLLNSVVPMNFWFWSTSSRTDFVWYVTRAYCPTSPNKSDRCTSTKFASVNETGSNNHANPRVNEGFPERIILAWTSVFTGWSFLTVVLPIPLGSKLTTHFRLALSSCGSSSNAICRTPGGAKKLSWVREAHPASNNDSNTVGDLFTEDFRPFWLALLSR